MHSIESRFVKDHQIYCLGACMHALFSPDILLAWAVKGLIFMMSDASLFPRLSRAGACLQPAVSQPVCSSNWLKAIVHSDFGVFRGIKFLVIFYVTFIYVVNISLCCILLALGFVSV